MNKLVVILGVALVTVGVGLVYVLQQLGELRNQNGELQARVTALESAPNPLASLFTPRSAPAANAGDIPTSDAPTTPGQARPAARAAAANALLAGIQEMVSSPEGKQMALAQTRSRLQQRYPDLAKVLNLSPEEANKLLDLIARQQMDLAGDSLNMLTGANREGGLQALQGQVQASRQASDAELAAMLGNKYPQWQEYQKSLPTREQVTRLQTVLGTSGNTLSDTQSNALITALAAEQQRISQESASAGTQTPEQRQQRTADNNRRLVNTASGHLNAQQLESYKNMLDQQQNITQLLRGLGAGQRRSGAAGTGAQAPAGAP